MSNKSESIYSDIELTNQQQLNSSELSIQLNSTFINIESKHKLTSSFKLQSQKTIPEIQNANMRRILKNNLFLLAITNIFVMIVMLVSILLHQWFLFYKKDPDDRVWFSLLYINYYTKNQPKGDKSSFNFFENQICPKIDFSNRQFQTDCSNIHTFYIAGIITFTCFVFGFIVQIMYIFQLFYMAFGGNIKRFKYKLFTRPMYFRWTSLITYICCTAAYPVIAIIINHAKFKHLGFAYFIMFSINILYMIVILYYKFVKQKLQRRTMVDQMLNALNVMENQQYSTKTLEQNFMQQSSKEENIKQNKNNHYKEQEMQKLENIKNEEAIIANQIIEDICK